MIDLIEGYDFVIDESKTCTVAKHVKEIPDEAFCHFRKRIKHFNLPEGLEIIGNYAFAGTGIKSITIPRSVKVIKNGILSWCEDLEEVKTYNPDLFNERPYNAHLEFSPKVKNVTLMTEGKGK